MTRSIRYEHAVSPVTIHAIGRISSLFTLSSVSLRRFRGANADRAEYRPRDSHRPRGECATYGMLRRKARTPCHLGVLRAASLAHPRHSLEESRGAPATNHAAANHSQRRPGLEAEHAPVRGIAGTITDCGSVDASSQLLWEVEMAKPGRGVHEAACPGGGVLHTEARAERFEEAAASGRGILISLAAEEEERPTAHARRLTGTLKGGMRARHLPSRIRVVSLELIPRHHEDEAVRILHRPLRRARGCALPALQRAMETAEAGKPAHDLAPHRGQGLVIGEQGRRACVPPWLRLSAEKWLVIAIVDDRIAIIIAETNGVQPRRIDTDEIAFQSGAHVGNNGAALAHQV